MSIRGRKGIYSLGEECEVNGYVIAGSESERGEQKQFLVLSTGVFPGAGIVVRGRYSGGSRVRDGSLYARECYYFARRDITQGYCITSCCRVTRGWLIPVWMQGAL